MQIIFMGTPAFAVPTLQALHHKGHEILAVFAQPDRPAGRGRGIAFSPVKQKALELHLLVCQPAKLKDIKTVECLSDLKPDVLVVVAYGLLLPQNILDIPKYGAVNLHPSLLPKYRGAAPINHALINGEKTTGITSILMNSRMDAGDIILQEEVSVDGDENAGEIETRLAKLGADIILKSLEVVKSESYEFKKQDEALVTYAPKLSSADGHIRWENSSEDIRNCIRGLTPRPGAFTMFKGKRLEILKAQLNNECIVSNIEQIPGQVVSMDKNRGPIVKTGDGTIVLTVLKPQGKKAMSGDEFLRGYKPAVGEQLL